MRKLLVIGASSAIAEATSRLFAAEGDALYLVGRDGQKLQAIADDLRIRGAALVKTSVMDATDYDGHETMVNEAIAAMDGLDTVLIAHGILPDLEACQASFDAAREALEVNFLSVASFLTVIANFMEKQGAGVIAVISSVAGDRGRKSNYIYGTAKAAVTTFLQGLRNRLHASGVRVVTIKPGFVDTPMTSQIDDKNFLFAQPSEIANGIHRAVTRPRNVVYLPSFWRLIMLIIRGIPESLFKRLSL